jgi:general secretion pathway protein B
LTTEITAPPPRPARTRAGRSNANRRSARDAAPSPAAPANEDARLPRFADLVMRGELNVPHMHIDIHVFSEIPAERFVFINMRKYNEGAGDPGGAARRAHHPRRRRHGLPGPAVLPVAGLS